MDRQRRKPQTLRRNPWVLGLITLVVLYGVFLLRVRVQIEIAPSLHSSLLNAKAQDTHAATAALRKRDEPMHSSTSATQRIEMKQQKDTHTATESPQLTTAKAHVEIQRADETQQHGKPAKQAIAAPKTELAAISAAPVGTTSKPLAPLRGAPTHLPSDLHEELAAALDPLPPAVLDQPAPSADRQIDELQPPQQQQHAQLLDQRMVDPLVPPAKIDVQADAWQQRHHIVAGYDALTRFLASRTIAPTERVFLFFTCSDDAWQPMDWSIECEHAAQQVHAAFAAAPRETTHLITVLAGSQQYWANDENDFAMDADLRVEQVPCVMQWRGLGRTASMLIGESLLLPDAPLLRYIMDPQPSDRIDAFFRSVAIAPNAMAATKAIQTVLSYTAYQRVLQAYAAEPAPRVPLFLLFISGRRRDNDRMWCPYCRYSHVPMEFAFRAFAPPNARLLRVEVTTSYPAWQRELDFHQDEALGFLYSVPAFYRVREYAAQDLRIERIQGEFDSVSALRAMYGWLAEG